ncbi:MAG: hypothetical protein ABW277_27050 [Longimicrobiaceae bacterium]
MDRDEAARILRIKLRDLEPLNGQVDLYSFETIGSNLAARDRPLPAPYMVYLTLVGVLDYRAAWMPTEKTLWSIPAMFKRVPVLLEHGKFGLRVSAKGAPPGLLDELVSALLACFAITDRVFGTLAEQRIAEGRVTIPNHFSQFDGRYWYFRNLAIDRFASDPPPETVIATDIDGNPTGWASDPLKPQREGFYSATAMLDAFFSRLEHFLILAWPFTSFRAGEDNLQEFIGAAWGTKYRTIFDFAGLPGAHRTYDELLEVKENYRNRLAHGGMDREGGSLFVHFEGVGAIPARLSAGATTHIYPISEITFNHVCEVFDRADEFLRTGPPHVICRYIESGFDVAFDQESVAEYRSYLNTPSEELEHLLEQLAYRQDYYGNMEW